jgi:hypothetical protein
MKTIFYFLKIITIGICIASVYGVLHDQLTYAISPEYYTKFKFEQFNLYWLGNNIGTGKTPEIIPYHPTLAVALVGALATWWVGLFMALILGIVGLKIKDHPQRTKKVINAFIIALSITFITGLIGLFVGKYYLNTQNTNWYMPDNLVDRYNFIAVGSMHNFGYIGAAMGLVIGVVYLLRLRKLPTYI